MDVMRWTLLLMFLLLSGRTAFADAPVFINVSVDTSSLVGHPAGPFSIDFQLNGGSEMNDANNTVSIANVLFGAGGSAAGAPVLIGGATGDLRSGLQITDRVFFNAFTQSFTPGSELRFIVLRTTNVDTGDIPDQFSFAILDHSGAEIPTQSPLAAFLVVDINSANPAVQRFASDPTRTPRGGGPPLSIPATRVEIAQAIGIDIKPGDTPNSVNPSSNGNIPVAILSRPGFDAPAAIARASLTFGQSGDEASPLRAPSAEDVNGDGLLDLLCHFSTQAAAFTRGTTVGVLKGKTIDGTPVQGIDSVRLVPRPR